MIGNLPLSDSLDSFCVAREYATAFLRLEEKGDHFLELLPMLKCYAKSNVAKHEPRYYYEYVLSNAKKYPKECIDLVSTFHLFGKPDITTTGYDEDQPVKILIGSYNSLRTTDNHGEKYRNKAMKIFDRLLKDERFRGTPNKVVGHVDS